MKKIKNYLKILLFDSSFFILLFLFIAYAGQRMQGILVVMQGLGLELQSLDPQNNPAGAYDVVSQVQNFAQDSYLFVVVIVPVVIFLLYSIFQGSSWRGKHDIHYLWKFPLISFFPFLLIILNLSDVTINYFYVTLFILASFSAFLLYFNPDLIEFLRGVKRFYVYLPLFVVYAVLFFLILISGFLLYVGITTEVSSFSLFVPVVLFLLLFSLYKFFLLKRFS